jgi:hypothetical protein
MEVSLTEFILPCVQLQEVRVNMEEGINCINWRKIIEVLISVRYYVKKYWLRKYAQNNSFTFKGLVVQMAKQEYNKFYTCICM